MVRGQVLIRALKQSRDANLSDAPFLGLSFCAKFKLVNCTCMSGWSLLDYHACLDGMEDKKAAISHLSDTLKDAAKSLPEKCYKKPCKWKDATLSAVCA